VLPPDLRTRSMGDTMETPDDLNILYQGILKANRFLKEVLAERRPAGLLRYAKFALQNAVDTVIDNGRIGNAMVKRSSQELESVAKRLKGKKGRMRLNMLGKRVDYSARTVIVVDPMLKLDECGLPFVIAKELFRPFIVAEVCRAHRLIVPEPGRPHSKSREEDVMKQFLDLPEPEQWELLEKAMGERRIILNRAPTLHRLSVQAFRPRLVKGQALKIHPLVCSPFNADFDGDTMTMHLALGDEAQRELKDLMQPSRNLSSPATGDPVIGPTQDMVLGIYYLTSDPPPSPSEAPGPDGDGAKAPPRRCPTLESFEAAAEECAWWDLPASAALLVPRSVLLEAAPDAGEDDPLLAEAGGGDDEDLVQTTAGRALFFLVVHRGFRPRKRVEDTLLQELDDVPLATAA